MAPETVFGVPTRWERDSDKVAVLLPGAAYVPARPLLHFARTVLVRRGWSVQEIWWETPETRDQDEMAAWVLEQARAALDAEGDVPRVLLVAKSLGSFAAPLVAERGLPAIWLTPLLRYTLVADALRRSREPALLVGGGADRSWDGKTAVATGHEYVEIPGADHGLEGEDAVESARMLVDATTAMDRFVAALG
ncbi:alpha/beta hydrolase [Nonomuraea sp. FMUSA5-5]|uniref:Alpha/beta hydrolase n=1 Tax=Nonomuraea composti TaxID=2720023 RepID=A0ABX1B8B7_9ACTN|nr:alpha/beta hydrolase [Nonomuraea sp. FMUSA5-5]NJP92534.1 alpha/beta hydrolase [Nonomuraea sp. FMUSA5-5]